MEDEQIPRGRGDEHLGTVRCQAHPHEVSGVEELFVRAAVLGEPAAGGRFMLTETKPLKEHFLLKRWRYNSHNNRLSIWGPNTN